MLHVLHFWGGVNCYHGVNVNYYSLSCEQDGVEAGLQQSYSVKVINPAKKSEYSIRKWRATNTFTSVQDMRKQLKHDFADLFERVSEDEIEVGYLEPGHGSKERQHWLVDDNDLSDMYKMYEGKREIMLCFQAPEKGLDLQKVMMYQLKLLKVSMMHIPRRC